MKESNLQRKILEKLNNTPLCKAVSTTQGFFGRKGEPDIMGSYDGHMFVIEVKLPGGKPTEIQEKRLSEWQAAGAFAKVMEEVGEVDTFLNIVRGVY